MPIDPAVIGTELPEFGVDVERGRLRFFAKAIGETDPVYVDLQAAGAAGHRDLPVPPTFFFGLELQGPDSFGWLGDLGVDLRRVLHGEQEFHYHALAYAGDHLRFSSRITDSYSKKAGALDFLVKETDVRRDGEDIVTLRQILVVRNPEVRP
ncbi:MaoC family dehydratase N-terminal domain-containing protein [Amycolatopsis nigrescens]|uniref:MaoC family dehydratase N-terminal domain-containing protein n=1 Tax=Amycolatopsis nigrescens TaxID=381445 RepID=UPI00037180C4|nr:MaoC family dehydratase N-terminal domain-containing protein [Amycolatopsis nigrescens]